MPYASQPGCAQSSPSSAQSTTLPIGRVVGPAAGGLLPHHYLMPGSKVKAGTSCYERKRLRARIGSLGNAGISNIMLQRYGAAVRYFVLITNALGNVVSENLGSLDQQMHEFIELCWGEGEPKWLMGDTLSGASFYIGKRRILLRRWKLYNVWDGLEETVQAPPLPVDLLAAILGWFVFHGRCDGAVSILIWCRCCL